ncbi:4Fe-4S dicluster domain-containing protein [Aliivibrio sp. SR45-2]|uniref:4Fe-4S dicluster domain-containing protein n=1 Tax=Aliivibrio sp. SR45-2 TaxID=2760931 RepID=UPI0015FC3101|nr:4Fe-4S dicluster domain-containing protein [Aliivibrio sp. SR45-2]MBB1314930.1 4Fe-4S dicluster domain-containing protein [Aliivibrio sp. SR45-2]
MLTQFLAQSETTNAKARQFAIAQTVELNNLIPPTVSYESRGNLVIIGPTRIIVDVAEQFTDLNSITLVSTESEIQAHESDRTVYFAKDLSVKGFLGAFDIECVVNGEKVNLAKVTTGAMAFDLVLDMKLDSVMSEQVPVPGYYPVGRGYPTLAQVLDELPGLVGTFDKPKYFRLNPDLCAHSSRGVKGCERCVDACPAGALTSEGTAETGHNIQINPYLCQGVGTCSTACPTEAISYALPEAEKTQNFAARLLANYKKEGGETPIIAFCSDRHENFNVMALKTMPDHIIPVVLDEILSVGIDTWFSALVNGAAQVLFIASRRMPETIQRVLTQEVEIAQAFLTQLGLEPERVQVVYMEALNEMVLIDTPLSVIDGPLTGNKRERLMGALDHLALNAAANDIEVIDVQAMPFHAPYGTIDCVTKDCTLCMGCVAVCPTRALHGDQDSPTLKFIEQDCVQCGLCVNACPEKALSMKVQMNWNKEERQETQIMHKEDAACCLTCNKPFAPASMIEMLRVKLQGNPHFSDEASINRLYMCEDCRVKDIFIDLSANPEKQLKV